MTASTAIYRTAARFLSRSILNSPIIQTIYVRRSVAAGEAVFPLSDLDLAMVIDPVPGAEIEKLRRRYLTARLAFPRLGECQVFTPLDLADFAVTDSYRASLDRRSAVTIFGPPPPIPNEPISANETVRRLVFWFDSYVCTALRQGSNRNLRKFALEMANALGVLEGRWPEPLTSRRETAERFDVPRNGCFAACCEYAARAHALLRPPAPKLPRALELPGLFVLPSPLADPPRTGVRVMTPEILDLTLQTQNPWLWRKHGEALAGAGFESPSRQSWIAAARRYAGGERLRGPGFFESGTAAAIDRLRAASSVLGGDISDLPAGSVAMPDYYSNHLDRLSRMAARLRDRACRA